MFSVSLLSDALLQHLPSYLGFSYLGRGVSLHICSSKAQPLLLTLNEGYLLTATLPDLQHGIAPLGTLVPSQAQLLRLFLPAAAPGFGRGVAPQSHRPCLRDRVAHLGCRPWLWTWGSSSQPLPLTSDPGCLLLATDLGHGVALLCCHLRLWSWVAPIGSSCTISTGILGRCP